MMMNELEILNRSVKPGIRKFGIRKFGIKW